MRKRIIDCGGEFHFNKKVIDFTIENNIRKAIKTGDGDLIYRRFFYILLPAIRPVIFFYCFIKKIF